MYVCAGMHTEDEKNKGEQDVWVARCERYDVLKQSLHKQGFLRRA